MSSSFRNVLKRKTHKERAQPSGRKHLGLLEKKKDYRLRARDYASKAARLAALRRKAELRNADEFYFGMVSERTSKGVHVKERDNNVSAEVLALFRTQDKAYLDAVSTHEKRRVEKLKEQLHFVGAVAPGRAPQHTIFVDTPEEAERFDAAEYFDTVPELVETMPHNRLTREQIQNMDARAFRVSARAGPIKGYEELARTQERVEKLASAQEHLKLKRDLMGKGARVKVKDAEGDKPAVFRWKNERKR